MRKLYIPRFIFAITGYQASKYIFEKYGVINREIKAVRLI